LNLFLTGQDSKLLENIVFMHLYKKYRNKLYYFKRKQEVDFYIHEEKLLLQVCLSLDNIETKQREVGALLAAMNELDMETSTIITIDEEDTITKDNKKIYLIPAWKFLLM